MLILAVSAVFLLITSLYVPRALVYLQPSDHVKTTSLN